MRLKCFILPLLYLFSVLRVAGQYYETGQDPSFLKWKQINSEHFNIIFPDNYSGQAVRYASELEKAFLKIRPAYQLSKINIPVIIHNYSIESNGLVSWAPKRIEIYPLPDPNGIPMNEVEQMALHELDHVFEIASLNQGFSKGLSYFFGEQIAGALSIYIPVWLLEGDAVYTETNFSATGRGNNPSFNKRIKALTLEDKGIYKYDKMLNGSFKTYTPDHYQFGYQMVSFLKNNYNSDLLKKTLLYTAQKPFSLNPVNLSLRKEAKLTKKKLFNETFDSLKLVWQKEEKNKTVVLYNQLNPEKKDEYINYYSPLYIGPDSIIAIKTSLYKAPSFVLIDSSFNEKKFHTPGTVNPYMFSYGNGKLVWSEYQPDPRWENRGYSVIKVLDFKNNRTRQLTRKSRLMAPSVSPDGTMIAAVESTPEYQNSLVILDADTGDRINTISTPENVFPQNPEWAFDGNSVTLIYLAPEGEGILQYDIVTGIWKTLMPASEDDIQSVYIRNDSLFWVSSSSGTDNVFMQTPGKKIFMITSSRFGAYDLNLNKNSLLFSDYTATGNNICRIYLKDQNFFEVTDNKSVPETDGEGEILKIYQPETISENDTFTQIPFNKFTHMFRFHSWMPFYADIEAVKSDPLSIRPGATLLSQNLLGTLTTSIGYDYSNENHYFHSQINWKGWYPIIEARVDYGGVPEILNGSRTSIKPAVLRPGQNLTTEISLPLSFSMGSSSQLIRPSFSVSYHNKYIYIPEIRAFDNGQTRFLGRLYFANYLKSSVRDIFPRIGQVIDYSYSFSPFDKKINGPVSSLKTKLYLPGLFRNQGVRLRFEAEIQSQELYILYNRVTFPRGYNNIISENMQLYSVDYAIPLLYPDFNIGSFIYFKRFRTNLFYDYAEASGNNYIDIGLYESQKEIFSSEGFELLSDFYLLRIPFMISAGMQTSYLNVSQSFEFKVLFSIDIFGLQITRSKL